MHHLHLQYNYQHKNLPCLKTIGRTFARLLTDNLPPLPPGASMTAPIHVDARTSVWTMSSPPLSSPPLSYGSGMEISSVNPLTGTVGMERHSTESAFQNVRTCSGYSGGMGPTGPHTGVLGMGHGHLMESTFQCAYTGGMGPTGPYGHQPLPMEPTLPSYNIGTGCSGSTRPYGLELPEKSLAEFPGRDQSSLRNLTVCLARRVVFGDETLATSSQSGRYETN